MGPTVGTARQPAAARLPTNPACEREMHPMLAADRHPSETSARCGDRYQRQWSIRPATMTERSPQRKWCACRSEEHTSELQSHSDLVCRLLLEKKKKNITYNTR